MKEMQKEMKKLTTEQKDQLTEFHTNNIHWIHENEWIYQVRMERK